jgi:hypothetical protein
MVMEVFSMYLMLGFDFTSILCASQIMPLPNSITPAGYEYA